MLTEQTEKQLKLIRRYVGEEFSLAQFRDFVSFCRGKNLQYVRKPLQGGITGFAIALKDCDVVCLCADAEEPLAEFTDIHELCHLILGHVKRVSYDMTLDDFLSISNEDLRILYRDHVAICRGEDANSEIDGSLFTRPMEYDAETLATVIEGAINRHKASKPEIIRRLFGGD